MTPDGADVDPRWRDEPGGIHVLRATTRIQRTRDEVFPFFADAGNLERITPPELRFEIVTPEPIEMRRGTLIEYRLGLWGARFGWRTEITDWSPPHTFTDSQIRGPYHTWIHRHDFEAELDAHGGVTGGTIMTDEVRYRLPFWPVGEVALPVVSRQLRRIFRHRAQVIREILG
ncbi:MAG: SRPBCC family protein [Longimicrobiales bacterium]|nr:SRPBCC family protein [Longimicrobiales bacterium]